MAALLVFEEHPDFASASRTAKELAVRFKTSTRIQRSSEGWVVLVPHDVLTALTPLEDSEAECEDHSDPYDDDYQREVVQPLIQELQEDLDSYARSEEDGWFYAD